ncbi:MAG: hypothetical protein NTX50_04715 [Candidatus Sumerlaeota bacterium]|nr:hypothetical protein [Candidatus Sumerlaeota bacterium]
MISDPVIEAIRAVRHQISAEYGHDTHAMLEHHRELEKKYKNRMLSGLQKPRKRVTRMNAASHPV